MLLNTYPPTGRAASLAFRAPTRAARFVRPAKRFSMFTVRVMLCPPAPDGHATRATSWKLFGFSGSALTWILYSLAPATVVQVNVTFVRSTPVELSVGDV